MFVSGCSWREGLTYDHGRLRVGRVEIIRGVGKERCQFISVLTAFSQGMEVDESAALITDAAALIAEHTHEQHQRNDGQHVMLRAMYAQ